jgi:polysaccharide export outer membrane protein
MRNRLRNAVAWLPAVVWLTGCADFRAAQVATSQHSPVSLDLPSYRVGCPDVLLVTFVARPDWDCLVSVDVDGTLPLAESLGRPRVQGLTIEETRRIIAEAGHLSPDGVAVSLADPRATRVYVSGPFNAKSRAVPYRGPEPVLDFLVRIGAIQQAATNVNRVYVVRPNVAVGEKADVFHVDVDAVALDGDQLTNIAIQPGDQIYVGETRRSSFSRLVPSWLRPLYRSLVGLLPPDPQWWWTK